MSCAVCTCLARCTHLHMEGNGERAKMQMDLRVRPIVPLYQFGFYLLL
jgi:hypothetical protein